MHKFLYNFWEQTEVSRNLVKGLTVGSHALIVLVLCLLGYMVIRNVLIPLIRKFIVYTNVTWDDILFSTPILRAVSVAILAILLHVFLPNTMTLYPWLFNLVSKGCEILLVAAFVHLIDKVFVACYDLLAQDKRIRMQPLKGLVQMLQLITIIVGIIICISIVIDRNPGIILTSLGASAAVLMLVFKDTILGVVAGVQLSANDMLKKGDWIVVPGTDVNGVVQDVTLTTVKVQNFDNTILTVPPYNLVSGSFQNWRGMSESGGRRIMRSILIDVRSIRFCTDEEVNALGQYDWFKATTDHIDARTVNLTAFRYYLEDFIKNFALSQLDYTYMVRQLEPTPNGVPVQIYCFTNQTDWKKYEHVQADLFDHIYAMIGTFGLRIYQSPTADDILSIAHASSPAPQPATKAFDPAILGRPDAARPHPDTAGIEVTNPHLHEEPEIGND